MASSSKSRDSSTGAVGSARYPTYLPPYQSPTNPLNQDAQRALYELPRTHRLDSLSKHLTQATRSITVVAGDVNDRYQKKLEAYQKRKARRQQHGTTTEDDEGQERTLATLKLTVEAMTGKLEESIRKIIDAKAAVEGVESALRELSNNVTNAQGGAAPTQSTLGASQFRHKRRRRDPDSESAESEGEEEPSQPQPLVMLKRKMTEHNTNYENLSLRHKYALNNDYVGFKKIVHDACNPENDARPMPHASTWFPDPQTPKSQPVTAAANGRPTKPALRHDAAPADDEDDEIEVASERISIKCPLTLLPMRDPVSSAKCPHSFERIAIMELLSASQVRIPVTSARGGGRAEKAMKCPVCEVMLSSSDLHTDPVLVRKIARVQAALAARSDSDSDPDTLLHGSGAEEIGDDDDDDDDDGDNKAKARRNVRQDRKSAVFPNVKDERALGSASAAVEEGWGGREVSMVPGTQFGEEGEGVDEGTQVVDLED